MTDRRDHMLMVPVYVDHDAAREVGSLRINEAALPGVPVFSLSPGYRNAPADAESPLSYELVEVSIVPQPAAEPAKPADHAETLREFAECFFERESAAIQVPRNDKRIRAAAVRWVKVRREAMLALACLGPAVSPFK